MTRRSPKKPNPTPEQRRAAYLQERGVDTKYAARAGLKSADAKMAAAMCFPYARQSEGGIVIPYLHPLTKEPHPTLMRIRYLGKLPVDPDGKEVRYIQPRDSGVEAYFDPNVDWATVLPDVRVTIAITEGEIKALALNQQWNALGVVTIALGGVWMFKEKQCDNLTPWLRAMRELGRGREYIIAFDSDMATNPGIQAAATRLAGLLA